MSILIYKNEQQEGPYDLDTIKQGLLTGRFTQDDYAFQDGCEDWVALSTLIPTEPTHQVEKASLAQKLEQKLESIDSTLTGLIGDDQDPKVVQKVIAKARELLTRDEEIEYIAVQKKPIITIAPDAVLLTNKRFMIVRPKMMGMTFEDHIWRSVEDVHMSEQMMTATITCKVKGGNVLSIDSIPKKQARKIYSYAQEVEERMIEERRVRDMEEKRAAAGGVVIHGSHGMGAATAQQSQAEDPMAVLGKLKKMLDAGLIQASEYESKKADILAKM
jgi:hypothetical protein